MLSFWNKDSMGLLAPSAFNLMWIILKIQRASISSCKWSELNLDFCLIILTSNYCPLLTIQTWNWNWLAPWGPISHASSHSGPNRHICLQVPTFHFHSNWSIYTCHQQQWRSSPYLAPTTINRRDWWAMQYCLHQSYSKNYLDRTHLRRLPPLCSSCCSSWLHSLFLDTNHQE